MIINNNTLQNIWGSSKIGVSIENLTAILFSDAS